ncbi:MAG: hypothetical protein EHM72_13675 [Calditrichaeota bacterium]|nr:MAG: hypothetical protein EHM72_13675 [Calditrichota bacterium]
MSHRAIARNKMIDLIKTINRAQRSPVSIYDQEQKTESSNLSAPTNRKCPFPGHDLFAAVLLLFVCCSICIPHRCRAPLRDSASQIEFGAQPDDPMPMKIDAHEAKRTKESSHSKQCKAYCRDEAAAFTCMMKVGNEILRGESNSNLVVHLGTMLRAHRQSDKGVRRVLEQHLDKRTRRTPDTVLQLH